MWCAGSHGEPLTCCWALREAAGCSMSPGCTAPWRPTPGRLRNPLSWRPLLPVLR
ncbi:hypothetical protein E2C01_079363 [Portunus trituberculatus]|uniref:Uncharacterized protein n=1 Tax=Portunus trituberculatus TaxID=210409 RepID=A0A5B7IR87_PORTR|nr:hypothetical protein [Portunus trituberculatus]